MPNQHGAWAFIITPWLLGLAWTVGAGRLLPEHVLLFAFWLVGYFAFFATSLWLKSRFKPRYRPAVVTYATAAAVLGLVVLALRPAWWSWVLAFAPLGGYALWMAWRRSERELVAGLATVVAACLLPLVMASDGLWRPGGLPEVPAIALVCVGYFFGTVVYVKTIIRERGRAGYVVASVAWHLGCALAALWAPPPLPAVPLSLFFVLMALRAGLVAALGPMRGRRVSAKAVGIGEFGSTLLLVAVVAPALL